MVLEKSDIRRPQELDGGKVGVTGIPFEEALFSTMLEYDGISMENIELRKIGGLVVKRRSSSP